MLEWLRMDRYCIRFSMLELRRNSSVPIVIRIPEDIIKPSQVEESVALTRTIPPAKLKPIPVMKAS